MTVASCFILAVFLVFAFLKFPPPCWTHNCISALFSLLVVPPPHPSFSNLEDNQKQPDVGGMWVNGRSRTLLLRRQAEHLGTRVFERLLLPPRVWMKVTLINITKCSLHTLNASFFQSEEGWWEVLSGRRMAPGHVSSLLQVIRPQGGSTKLEMMS